MARVREVPSSELPPDAASVYERFARDYGPFRNQVAVFAHVPAAVRHLMGMLMELREAKTLPKRYLELAIVAVSKANECHYCVAHHKPFLTVEGVSPAGVDRVLEWRDHPELDEVDRLRRHFSEAQIVELTLRATLCGFFNRFNDALRIDEEPEALLRLDEVAARR